MDSSRFKLQGLSTDRREEALGRSAEMAELVANASKHDKFLLSYLLCMKGLTASFPTEE